MSPSDHTSNVDILRTTSYIAEFQQRLACQQHPGNNQWCWVDPHLPNSEHLPLYLHDIQLWVQYFVSDCIHKLLFWSLIFFQCTHGGHTSCTVLPNTAYFIELRKTRKPRTSVPPSRTTTELVVPASSDITSFSTSRRLTRQNAVYLNFDSNSDGNGEGDRECTVGDIMSAYLAMRHGQAKNLRRTRVVEDRLEGNGEDIAPSPK